MAAVANVQLTDTFNTWRVRSNQIFTRLNQFAINESRIYANTVVANTHLLVRSGASNTDINSDRMRVTSNTVFTGTTFQANNWTVQATNFNVASGANYFADVRGGAKIATLPTAAVIGDQFRVILLGGSVTNTLTVSRNGHRIQGELSNLVVTTANAGFGLVYANANTGWRLQEV